MTVITEHTNVINHLYLVDQFWGLSGSFGPSHDTWLGSGTVGVSNCEEVEAIVCSSDGLGWGSWMSSPPYFSNAISSWKISSSKCEWGISCLASWNSPNGRSIIVELDDRAETFFGGRRCDMLDTQKSYAFRMAAALLFVHMAADISNRLHAPGMQCRYA